MLKTRVLLLGAHDSKMAGHVQNTYDQIKDKTDAVMVTLYGYYGKASHCFWPLKGKGLSLWEKIVFFKYSKVFYFAWVYLYSLFRLRCLPIVDKKHPEYSFVGFEFLPYNVNDIIKKCPEGFVPDIIVIYWPSRFISSKMIHDLYQQTKAKIVYSFVDEAPMTGGCHYPMDCKGYLSGCRECPALLHGKKLASEQLKYKEYWLKDVPMHIIGSPYDMRLAKKTNIFINSNAIPGVGLPKVVITSRKEARNSLNIPENKFVVMIGATSIESVRKGFVYTMESINTVKTRINNLLLLVIGKTNTGFKENFPNVDVLELGFVDTNKMMTAYSASDCFLSTTIADSGPQMVNYSIASGTPVVSFSMGIAQDLVLHKETGYIAKFKDSKDLAEGIYYIYSLDSGSYSKMCDCCIHLINQKASQGGWKKQLLDVEQ